ncbi:uncharacterized protein LOC100526876 [Glycine max]|uniref:Uncharacterized protein n=1 Tax=Glycine max TaxID=3847 RepID=C6T2M0_SOYBN|nr:uncharacterized protein LOC100526876 [Glycine max]ACU15886.1 unknown [Glycine max]|eukprot:NP_001235379.1 uncharacterized protein LOC100526876 [Glycine max]
MDRVSHRGSRFLLDASPLLEFEFQPTMDPVINWVSNFLHSLQHCMDPVIKWFMSLISCLAAKINQILEKFTGHQFNVKTDACDEISLGGEWLLYVAIAVVVALAAIPVVWLLWKVVFGVVWLLWKLISGVVLLLWNVISTFVLGLWNVMRKIFCCCCERGKTMKAPGRKIRIYRDEFERSPKNYFRNLRRDQRNWRNNQRHTILV